MALGPIGNTIFVNQMTPAATNAQNAHNNRVDFQNVIAQELVQEKEKEVEEVRPTEENQEIDPDREHQKQEADEEEKELEERAKKQDDDTDEDEEVHKLDIKV